MATPSPSFEAVKGHPSARPLVDSAEVDATREASRPPLGENAPWLGVLRVAMFSCIRLAFAGFLFLTSLYCLLVWVPFSYFGFIRNPLLSWLPTFVHLHGLLYGVLLLPLAFTLTPTLRRNETRRAAIGFLLLNSGAALYLWRAQALAAIQPDLSSYFWSMLSLLPLVWLAALDLSMAWPEIKAQAGKKVGIEGTKHFDAAPYALAAVVVAAAFALTSLLRAAISGNPLSAGLALEGFALSLCFHLVIFVVIGVCLGFIAWLCARIRMKIASDNQAARRRLILTRSFAALLIFQCLRGLILPTISFGGAQAAIFAAAISFTVVLFATGFHASLRALVAKSGIRGMRIPSAWLWSVVALALLGTAYAIPEVLGRTDWDFVVQKISVMVLWLAVVSVIVALTSARTSASESPLRRKAAAIACYSLVAAAVIGFAVCAKAALYNPDPSPNWQAALDNYAGDDISFKTAYAVLSRPMDDKAYRQFYEFLKQHTNLPRSVQVGPADVSLVPNLQPTSGIKPNIFIFVIDSLRPDFISPYNPTVDYTPQIESFARDSVVLKNAFTRYGGTALSEPAIWTGAMQLHKQYIEPFYPMNNLQKLLATDGYHSYISVDPILSMMVQPSPSITELDKDEKAWAELDFVPTLKELQTKIDARTDRTQPIFAYTQPQNVHTMTLARGKIKGGRKAVNISELRRMDAAFGGFLAFLRQRGLYDNSIVMLTSDHGDCYGEFGRWGHSDFLFPQIIRIPFIVHLPPRMRQEFVWDANAVAFNADITPSLFYLLGHRPVRNNQLFGRPLFTRTTEEAAAYVRPQYLLVASYAPVYGTLSGDARKLFIVDAVNSKNYYFDLAQDPDGSRSHVTIPIEKENEAIIRHEVGLIDDLYGWHPADAP